MADGEEFNYSNLAPWTRKRKYAPVFGVPEDPWNVDASWDDAYFESSQRIIAGVVNGELMAGIHGRVPV